MASRTLVRQGNCTSLTRTHHSVCHEWMHFRIPVLNLVTNVTSGGRAPFLCLHRCPALLTPASSYELLQFYDQWRRMSVSLSSRLCRALYFFILEYNMTWLLSCSPYARSQGTEGTAPHPSSVVLQAVPL